MNEELEKIKAACTLAWQAKVPVTLTWEQAAAVLDALTVTGDMAAEARVAELEAATRWIPVTERLPEEGQNVLVIGNDGYFCRWLYTNKMVQLFIAHWTHWRPLEPLHEVEG